jgi:hypothetical protein
LLVAALAVLGLGVNPAPANATTLTITLFSCLPQRASFECDAQVSGGTGGNTYTWSPAPFSQYNYPDHSDAVIKCVIGVTYTISFTVRDSSGATANKSIGKYCSGANP